MGQVHMTKWSFNMINRHEYERVCAENRELKALVSIAGQEVPTWGRFVLYVAGFRPQIHTRKMGPNFGGRPVLPGCSCNALFAQCVASAAEMDDAARRRAWL